MIQIMHGKYFISIKLERVHKLFKRMKYIIARHDLSVLITATFMNKNNELMV